MKITIHVTKEVLEKTRDCKSDMKTIFNCAISYAVRQMFPYAAVHRDSIFFDTSDLLPDLCGFGNLKRTNHDFAILPIEAQEFIDEFDESSPEDRLEMQPISFDIDVPASVIEKIGLSEVYRILSESKTLTLAEI